MPDEIPLVSLEEDAYYQDPAGFFAWLRESQPVAPVRMPVRGRAWFITRYEDVWAALADPRLANDVHRWPGGARQRPSEAAGGVHAHLLNSDPPDHTRLRRLAWKAFTPRRVARLRPRAEEVAAGLLDDMEAAGDVADLLDVYARPLPGAVLCELLGIPEADRGQISAAVADYDKPGEADRVTRQLAAYLTELIAAKRADLGRRPAVGARPRPRRRQRGRLRGRADRHRGALSGLPDHHGGLRHHGQPHRQRHPRTADPPAGSWSGCGRIRRCSRRPSRSCSGSRTP